ncbi:MAG: ABC transporter permease [Chloroflexota bacterium]
MGPRFALWWALFTASVKMFVRNRLALFFSLFLPLLVMLIFGVLNFEGSTSVDLGIVDEANSDGSAAFRSALAETDYLDITEGQRADELAELEKGDRDFVLVIPADFAPTLEGETGLVAFASTADPSQAQVGRGLLQQAVGGAIAAATGLPIPSGGFSAPLAFEAVTSRDLGYIDFLVPGVVGMTVMQLGLFGVAFGFVQLKRTGALRRLFATPTSPAYFLSAQVASRVVLGYVQVAILIGIGIWFGLQMFGSWLVLAAIVGLGFMIFLAVGYGIAGWAKNEDQAAPVANIISLPMLFLSGVFFPRDAMPEVLRGITGFMPLTYVNEALRGVMNDGAGFTDLGPQLLGMVVWAVIAFTVAVLLFKWE